jgi:hypothetical protein
LLIDGKPVFVANNGYRNEGKATGEIVSGACNQSNAGSIAPRENVETVMLDFVTRQPGPEGGALAADGRYGPIPKSRWTHPCKGMSV